MTHDEAFLEDIAEHPEDDTPRLVYADWLDDQGDLDRAEFIRVQCELARLAEEDPRREELGQRERQLLAEHQERWVESVRPYLTEWQFRRGMIEWARIEPATFTEHAPALYRQQPIVHVQFAPEQEESVLHRLFECPYLARIQSLQFRAVILSSTALSYLCGCRRLERLTSLVLDTNGGIHPETIQQLAAAPFVGQLQQLQIILNQLGANAIEALTGCRHLGRLIALNLAGNDIGTSGAQLLGSARHLGALQTLNLRCNGIGPAGMRALAQS
jgi:uncharacterized protein (TIGR02996 family)